MTNNPDRPFKTRPDLWPPSPTATFIVAGAIMLLALVIHALTS